MLEKLIFSHKFELCMALNSRSKEFHVDYWRKLKQGLLFCAVQSKNLNSLDGKAIRTIVNW
jgi:hypothetical protein